MREELYGLWEEFFAGWGSYKGKTSLRSVKTNKRKLFNRPGATCWWPLEELTNQGAA